MPKKKIEFLYTEIGRGHPFYLDGIIDEINRDGDSELTYLKYSVFDHASGLTLKLWQLVRFLYSHSGKNTFINRLYKQLRQKNSYEKDSILIKLLGMQLNKQFYQNSKPLLVAHPLLVSILRKHTKVSYQHGELITPHEAVVSGAKKVYVPIKSAGQPFLSKYKKEQIIVTGLCIEPSIRQIAESAFHARMKRFEDETSLTGCFISSGAEPKHHVEAIVHAVVSHLLNKGKAFVFVKKDGLLEKSIHAILPIIDSTALKINSLANLSDTLPKLTIVQFNNRQNENKFTSHFFHQFDFFMSPSHERSNWAVGLGLPMFIADPAIGPFSPLNRKFLLDSQTAHPIKNNSEAIAFALLLKKMHIEKQIKQMACNGWDKYPIDGFKKIVHNISKESS